MSARQFSTEAHTFLSVSNIFLRAYFYGRLAHALRCVGNRFMPYPCPLFWIYSFPLWLWSIGIFLLLCSFYFLSIFLYFPFATGYPEITVVIVIYSPDSSTCEVSKHHVHYEAKPHLQPPPLLFLSLLLHGRARIRNHLHDQLFCCELPER